MDSGESSAPAYFKRVDLSAALDFEPLARDGRTYVARLARPLSVVSPPVELATDVDPAVPHAHILPRGSFRAFLESAEAAILEACVVRRAAWFPKDVTEDALRGNFKSFFSDSGSFKVRVPPDVGVFDGADPAGHEEAAAGTSVRCVLELQRICFGRREFGAMWKLAQVRVAPPVGPCLVPDAEPAEDAEGPADAADAAPTDPVGDELEFE